MQQEHETITKYPLLGRLLEPLFYYDVFSHPLTKGEIYTYANIQRKTLSSSLTNLLEEAVDNQMLVYNNGFYQLSKNDDSIKKRLENNRRADKYIRRAKWMSRLMLCFPFVRAVFVSGSLSKHVITEDGDIDYFIVTKPGRLWIARTFLILFKKICLFNSYKHFCVNYFVDENHLEIDEKNRFTATEVATILPMKGYDLYVQFINSNQWIKQYYPNCKEKPKEKVSNVRRTFFQILFEWMLDNKLGDRLDDYCMRRTLQVWQKKFPHLPSEDFQLALKTRKGVSKHHPQLFQNKVISAFNDRVSFFEHQHGLDLEIQH